MAKEYANFFLYFAFIRIFMKVINYFKKFLYPTPKQTCMNCNKEKKKIIDIRICCDLESVENIDRIQIESLSLCKKCVVNFAKMNLMKISLYSFTRNSVAKLLYADLTERGELSLKEMQDVLKKESEFRMKTFEK
jgi:hypothetical protein